MNGLLLRRTVVGIDIEDVFISDEKNSYWKFDTGTRAKDAVSFSESHEALVSNFIANGFQEVGRANLVNGWLEERDAALSPLLTAVIQPCELDLLLEIAKRKFIGLEARDEVNQEWVWHSLTSQIAMQFNPDLTRMSVTGKSVDTILVALGFLREVSKKTTVNVFYEGAQLDLSSNPAIQKLLSDQFSEEEVWREKAAVHGFCLPNLVCKTTLVLI